MSAFDPLRTFGEAEILRNMKVTVKRLSLAAFLLWEAWWAYVFFDAPVPDYRMDTVFALLMGVALPVVAAIAYLLFVGLAAMIRRAR
nr:hypothetical protein [uncultured Sphingomonas sp.]